MTASPKVRRVAIVGAGISGVLSAAHLLAAGIEVVVFERNNAPGGVWVYNERTALSPSYPSIRASEADLPPMECEGDEAEFTLRYAPPGPCYHNLKTNVPTPLMEVTLLDWPESTPLFAHNSIVRKYIEDLSTTTGVHRHTIYSARVQEVKKDGPGWEVTWIMLQKKSTEIEHTAVGITQSHQFPFIFADQMMLKYFDAVVLATGHYHAPRVPNIAGLAQAKKRYPTRIMHSKEYRVPDSFKDKKVLLIGGGVSSVDIANDISPLADTIYQSTRNSHFDLDPRMLPANATRVDEVAVFHVPDDSSIEPLLEHEPLPISVQLVTGKVLNDIDTIVLCTGYQITLPFMQTYHSDITPLEEADERLLVTDGSQVHNLHKDIFYMPDPTLAFVGLPYYTFTFSVFDFQAITVAQVFSGAVDIPSQAEMRDEYEAKVKEVGLGKTFHSVHNKEEVYVGNLMSWVNVSRATRGLEPLSGFGPKWFAAKEAFRQRVRAEAKKAELLAQAQAVSGEKITSNS
ncbi:hypothetical protein MFIFM68171_07872 [Madurella fahalii]|uniref:Flavin-containing monooxygenase n=1 Tax=Madurella fahalii TaxID=1157608 RepID=A0ABQ0GIS8_9PEZI